ncbi:NAD(+)/NADH kinase [Candidatus Woesearchaeota archaeon]|nr:NAD(+)/NADH kinase [Candidatus Woesearchaeota archaeon]
MRTLIVANPNSHEVRRNPEVPYEALEAVKRAYTSCFGQDQTEFQVHRDLIQTPQLKEFRYKFKDQLTQDVDMIITLGGDGTIHEVVNEMVHHYAQEKALKNKPLPAVIPDAKGSFCVIPKQLGYNGDDVTGLEGIIQKKLRKEDLEEINVPLLKVNDEYAFYCSAGIVVPIFDFLHDQEQRKPKEVLKMVMQFLSSTVYHCIQPSKSETYNTFMKERRYGVIEDHQTGLITGGNYVHIQVTRMPWEIVLYEGKKQIWSLDLGNVDNDELHLLAVEPSVSTIFRGAKELLLNRPLPKRKRIPINQDVKNCTIRIYHNEGYNVDDEPRKALAAPYDLQVTKGPYVRMIKGPGRVHPTYR